MNTTKTSWFRMEVKGAIAEIFVLGMIGDWIDDLFEDIGWGFDSIMTAKKFKAELDALPADVTELRLHVNSPGGDVWGAVTIANMLRAQRDEKGRKVVSIVEGLAASAASIIIQAGDPVQMADNALLVIHDPWTTTAGNAAELQTAIDELEKVKSAQLVPTYQWHSELSAEEISALMSAETWMDVDEAIANGFATEKVGGLKAAAAFTPADLKRALAKIPDKYRERVESFLKNDPTPEPVADSDGGDAAASPADVLRLCREGGCIDVAEDLVVKGASIEAVTSRIATEKKVRSAAAEREKAIRGLCAAQELPELADGYVAGGMDLAAVKAHITTITAKLDKAEIDAGIDPDAGKQQTKGDWKKAFSRAVTGFGAARRGKA